MGNHLEEWHWLDEEHLQKIKDERDDYDAPRFGLRYNQGVQRNQILYCVKDSESVTREPNRRISFIL